MATTMAATLFYVLHYPATLTQPYAEIDSTFSNMDEIVIGTQLTSCQYLRACIDETMRLSPPVGGGLPREVLAGGITIEGNFFPEGTDISVPIYALHHKEEYFRNADIFDPQRWLDQKKEGTDAADTYSAFNPFSLGPRGCPGKALAYAEMMPTLARMVWMFEMRLDGGTEVGEDEPVLFKTRDHFVSVHDGPHVQFKRRKQV